MLMNNQNLPSIRLEFFRHDEKLKGHSQQPEDKLSDEEIRITKAWKQHAREVWKEKKIRSKAVGYSSPRKRAQETLYHTLNFPWIAPDASLEEIKEILPNFPKNEIHSIRIDKHLDFYFWEDGKTDAEKQAINEVYEAYNSKKYIYFIFDKSDNWLVKLKDKNISSYSKCAGDIAEMILRYYNLKDAWTKKIDRMKKNIEIKSWEIQRLFCTHAWVLELFLMKVIEKQRGREAVRQFIEHYWFWNGFGYSEWYSIVITQNGATLNFKDESFEISEELLKDIIKDRDDLYAKIS